MCFGLICVVSIICIWLYLDIKHNIFAIISSVGAYIAPVFIAGKIDPLFLFCYFLICSMTFSIISIRVNSRLLTLISSYLSTLMIGGIRPIDYDNYPAVIALGLNFFIFSFGAYAYGFVA
jgi:uncharacterized membrane protein